MLVSILQKAPILIVGLLLIIAAITIYFRAKNVNFTEFGQIFKTAKYFSTWVIILTILFTGVFSVFNHLKLRQSVHAIVSLNYSEASAAQNSNGTRYNMNEIISDEVIERAIKNGAFEGVTVKQLRNCLSVYPCVQGDVADETQYHISTEFAVEYHASKHTSHLDAHNVIKLIVASYKEYYIEKCKDDGGVPILYSNMQEAVKALCEYSRTREYDDFKLSEEKAEALLKLMNKLI